MNVGASLHTVTSGHGSSSPDVGSEFDAQLQVGKTFSHTFDKAGDYPYFCRIHEPNMAGSVAVE
jgi:plastocyanin